MRSVVTAVAAAAAAFRPRDHPECPDPTVSPEAMACPDSPETMDKMRPHLRRSTPISTGASIAKMVPPASPVSPDPRELPAKPVNPEPPAPDRVADPDLWDPLDPPASPASLVLLVNLVSPDRSSIAPAQRDPPAHPDLRDLPDRTVHPDSPATPAKTVNPASPETTDTTDSPAIPERPAAAESMVNRDKAVLATTAHRPVLPQAIKLFEIDGRLQAIEHPEPPPHSDYVHILLCLLQVWIESMRFKTMIEK